MTARLTWGLMLLVLSFSGCTEETSGDTRGRTVAPAMEKWAAPTNCGELCQHAVRCKVKSWKTTAACEKECRAAEADAGDDDFFKCLYGGMSCWNMNACTGAKLKPADAGTSPADSGPVAR